LIRIIDFWIVEKDNKERDMRGKIKIPDSCSGGVRSGKDSTHKAFLLNQRRIACLTQKLIRNGGNAFGTRSPRD
jgi:hypothetical protein